MSVSTTLIIAMLVLLPVVAFFGMADYRYRRRRYRIAYSALMGALLITGALCIFLGWSLVYHV